METETFSPCAWGKENVRHSRWLWLLALLLGVVTSVQAQSVNRIESCVISVEGDGQKDADDSNIFVMQRGQYDPLSLTSFRLKLNQAVSFPVSVEMRVIGIEQWPSREPVLTVDQEVVPSEEYYSGEYWPDREDAKGYLVTFAPGETSKTIYFSPNLWELENMEPFVGRKPVYIELMLPSRATLDTKLVEMVYEFDNPPTYEEGEEIPKYEFNTLRSNYVVDIPTQDSYVPYYLMTQDEETWSVPFHRISEETRMTFTMPHVDYNAQEEEFPTHIAAENHEVGFVPRWQQDTKAAVYTCLHHFSDSDMMRNSWWFGSDEDYVLESTVSSAGPFYHPQSTDNSVPKTLTSDDITEEGASTCFTLVHAIPYIKNVQTGQPSYAKGQQMDISFKIDNWKFYYSVYQETMLQNLFVTFDQGQTRQTILNASIKNGVVTASVKAPEIAGNYCMEIGVAVNDWTGWTLASKEYYPAVAFTNVTITNNTPAFVPIQSMSIGGVPDIIYFETADCHRQYTAFASITPATATYQGGTWSVERKDGEVDEVLSIDNDGRLVFRKENPTSIYDDICQSGVIVLTFVSDEYAYRVGQGEHPNIADFTLKKEVTLLPSEPAGFTFYNTDQRQDVYGQSRDILVDYKIDADETWNLAEEGTVKMTVEAKDGVKRTLTIDLAEVSSERDDKCLHVYVPLTLNDHEYSFLERHGHTMHLVWTAKTSVELPFVNSLSNLPYTVNTFRYINYAYDEVAVDEWPYGASPHWRDIAQGAVDYVITHAYNLPKEYFNICWDVRIDENWNSGQYYFQNKRVESWSTTDGTEKPDWLQLTDRGDGYYDAKIIIPIDASNFQGRMAPVIIHTGAGNEPGENVYKPTTYIHYTVFKKENLHCYVQRPYGDIDTDEKEVMEGQELDLSDSENISAFNNYLSSYEHKSGNELFEQIASLRKGNILTIGSTYENDDVSGSGFHVGRQMDIKVTGGLLGTDTLRHENCYGETIYFPMADATYKIILHNKVFNSDRVINYTTHALPGKEHIYGFADNVYPHYFLTGGNYFTNAVDLLYATQDGTVEKVPHTGQWSSVKWFYEPKDILCFNIVDLNGKLIYNTSGFWRGFTESFGKPSFVRTNGYSTIFDNIDNIFAARGSSEFASDGKIHLTLHNMMGETVGNAHVNYAAVDGNGTPTGGKGTVSVASDGNVVVPFNEIVSDQQSGSVFMEVVANGYEPKFYKYNLQNQSYRHLFNSMPSNEVDIVLETADEATTPLCRADLMQIVEANADTTAVTFNIVDMTAYNLVDRIGYKEEGPIGGTKSIYGIKANGSNYSFEKRWEGEKFAQLGISFQNKNNAQDYSQLRLTGFGNAKDCTPTQLTYISKDVYTSFEHNYIDATFDLVGFTPSEKMAIPVLKVGNADLAQLPKLHNEELDMDSIARNTKVEIVTNRNDFDMSQVGPQASAQDCDLGDNAQLFDGIDFDFPDVMGFQFQVKKVGAHFQIRGVYSKNFLPGGDQADMVDAFTDQMKDYANQFDRVFKDCVNSCTGQKDIEDEDFDFMADKDPLFANNDAFVGIRAFISGIAYVGPKGEFMVNFHEGGLKLEMSGEYNHNCSFGIGAFGAKLSGELSTTLKLLNRAADTGDVYNFDLNVMVETQVRAEIVAWAKAGLNILNLVKAEVGVRGGASVTYKSGTSYPILNNPDHTKIYAGHKIELRSGMFIYADARFLFWRKHWEQWFFKYKKDWCWPDDPTNPYSDSFEWGPSIFSAKPMGQSFKKVKPRRVVGLGNLLMNNVTGIASPRLFNHGSSLIYNRLNTPGDYNDDRLMMFDLSTKTNNDINADATGAAFNFDVAERGDYGIVAYEQYNNSNLNSSAVNNADIDNMNNLSGNVGIQASVWDGSQWTTTKLSKDGVANLNPRAAVQEDGHAAVVWLSGTPKATNAENEADRRQYMDGQYLLSRFDGYEWSEPVVLANLRQSFVISDHKVVMSEDSILIYMEHRDEIASPENPYIDCITVTPNNKVSTVFGVERGRNPQIARVGDVNLVAYLTERSDSAQDIRLRTVDMQNTAVATTDGYALMSNRGVMNFKLAATENAQSFDDVALIWSQSRVKSSTDASTGNDSEVDAWLCAGRIGKSNNGIYVSYPEQIIQIPEDFTASAFDGYIDNDSLHVVYALSDISNDGTAVMQKGVKFTNGFRVKNCVITAANATSADNIPFKLYVQNTGYAPMTSLTASIGKNDVEFTDMNVLPGETTELTGYFAVDTDDYTGEEEMTVTAKFGKMMAHLAPRRPGTVRRQLQPEMPRLIQRTVRMRNEATNETMARRSPSDPTMTATQTLTCDVKTTDLSCTVLSNRIRGTKNTIIAKVANCSPLPLLPGQTVTAGLYASLTDTEPMEGSSLVEIPVNDLYSNSTPLTKVIKLQVENLPKDQQAFIKVIVQDGVQNVTDVKPENNYVPVPLYAKDGNVITILGDVNRDMNITIADVTALVNIILGKDNVEPYIYDHKAADVNQDNTISIPDVTSLVNIILGKQ